MFHSVVPFRNFIESTRSQLFLLFFFVFVFVFFTLIIRINVLLLLASGVRVFVCVCLLGMLFSLAFLLGEFLPHALSLNKYK